MQHLFLMEFFGRGQSGRSYAVTERLRLFRELGKDAKLVTFDYNPSYGEIFDEVAPDLTASHLNMMDYYQGQAVAGGVTVKRLHDAGQVTVADLVYNQANQQVGEILYGLENGKVVRRVATLYDEAGAVVLHLLYQNNVVIQVQRYVAGVVQVMSFEQLVVSFLEAVLAEQPGVLYADVLEETMTQAYGAVTNAVKKLAYIHADHHVGHEHVLVGFRNLLRGGQFDEIITGTPNQATDIAQEWQLATRAIAPLAIALPDNVTDMSEREENTVVVVTRLDPIKRIEDMIAATIKAHQKNRNIKLRLYGTISDQGYYAKLQQQVETAKANNYIVFEGATSTPTATFQVGQLTIFTSRTEGFGRTILEAMAAGTPVVSYDIDYGPRALIKDGGRLVPDGNVDALANAMVLALADKSWREKASQAARVDAAEFDKAHITAQWQALAEEVEGLH